MSGNVLGVLGWGLRKYAWIVAVCVLALGVLVPWLLSRSPVQYDAQAQVGPTDPLRFSNLDPLPRLGESVFTNGAVAATIRRSVQPPMPAATPVIPNRVELVTSQDNVVFVVVGHGSTPATAARFANLAATSFTAELNKYARSVGSFAVQKLATKPALPTDTFGGRLAETIGVVAGLVAGIGLVILVLAMTRPVLSAQDALEATGAQGFGRLRLARSGRGVRGLPQLIRRLRAHPADTVLVVGPRRSRADRRMLENDLTQILGPGGPAIVDGATPAQIATRPESSLVLLVVREGIGYGTLRRLAEQYLDGGESGVLLVHGHGGLPWRRRLAPTPLPAEVSGSGRRHASETWRLSAGD